jgi:uncharacterized protein (UPF0332 family)
VRPREFLDQAERLLEDDAGPADCRSAISRAYYAVFLRGKELLSAWGYPFYPPGGNAGKNHGLVKGRFKSVSGTDLEDLGKLLETLHTERKRADYDLHDAEIETAGTAKFIVGRAKEAFKLADEADGHGLHDYARSRMALFDQSSDLTHDLSVPS